MKLIIMKATINYINDEAKLMNPEAINKINEINAIITDKPNFVDKEKYLILIDEPNEI